MCSKNTHSTEYTCRVHYGTRVCPERRLRLENNCLPQKLSFPCALCLSEDADYSFFHDWLESHRRQKRPNLILIRRNLGSTVEAEPSAPPQGHKFQPPFDESTVVGSNRTSPARRRRIGRRNLTAATSPIRTSTHTGVRRDPSKGLIRTDKERKSFCFFQCFLPISPRAEKFPVLTGTPRCMHDLYGGIFNR